jgi:hypothetical protein
VLLFLITVLIVWPGAILKLSFLKAYAFMAYLAVYRKGAWGATGFAETWWIRFSNSPVEWILIAAALVLFFRNRKSPASIRPAVFFGSMMVLATLRVYSEAPRYALTFLPALEVFAGLTLAAALASLPAGIRVPAIVAVCATLFFNTLLRVHPFPPEADAGAEAILRCVRESQFEDKSLLVPQGYVPMLHYYFPKARLQGYLEGAPPANAFQAAHFDGVIFPGNPVRCAPAP